jgi:histidinol-phosphate aminotransferase
MLAQAAPQAAVLVDEAYFEFHGDTILNHAAWPANLFVARTFSKAYGLAGLRIGVLAGNAGQISMVRRVASPYNVNGVALAVLPEA